MCSQFRIMNCGPDLWVDVLSSACATHARKRTAMHMRTQEKGLRKSYTAWSPYFRADSSCNFAMSVVAVRVIVSRPRKKDFTLKVRKPSACPRSSSSSIRFRAKSTSSATEPCHGSSESHWAIWCALLLCLVCTHVDTPSIQAIQSRLALAVLAASSSEKTKTSTTHEN